LKDLKKHRDKTISMVEQCKVNLRELFGDYPYGEADGIQQVLVIGAHMFRHTMQIEEILTEMNSDTE